MKPIVNHIIVCEALEENDTDMTLQIVNPITMMSFEKLPAIRSFYILTMVSMFEGKNYKFRIEVVTPLSVTGLDWEIDVPAFKNQVTSRAMMQMHDFKFASTGEYKVTVSLSGEVLNTQRFYVYTERKLTNG